MKNIKTQKYLLVLVLLAGAIVIFSKGAMAAECSLSRTCGKPCSYGGVLYNTVIIGTQCWFKENLNVGTMILNLEIPDNTAPTVNDPNTVSKWCYNDSAAYCNTEGGLYTWAETNALPNSYNYTSCSVPTLNQGICPKGWHVPSDGEFYTLENYLTTPGQTCDPTRGDWGCSGAGNKLILGGSSGFDAIGAGNHETNGDLSFFDKREPSIHFWSSSPCLNCSNYGHSYNRALIFGANETVARSWTINAFGLSVRCLSDTAVVGPPTNWRQCLKKGWKIFNNPTFKSLGDCLKYFLRDKKIFDKLNKNESLIEEVSIKELF